MRTIFVNPRKRKRRKTTKSKRRTKRRRAKRRNPVARRRYRRRNPRRRRYRARRRRRRNITPGSSIYRANPLILQNPRRRRRRRNPIMPRLTMKSAFNKMLTYGGGSAIGAGVNILALNQIEDMWFRNGARIGVAVLGGMFLRGELGASMAGATMYPVWQEVAMTFLAPAGTEIDLNALSADLEEALDEVDELDF